MAEEFDSFLSFDDLQVSSSENLEQKSHHQRNQKLDKIWEMFRIILCVLRLTKSGILIAS
jgi:hypothetical protein